MIFDAPLPSSLGFKVLKKVEVSAASADLLAKLLGLPSTKKPSAGTVYIVQKTRAPKKAALAKKAG